MAPAVMYDDEVMPRSKAIGALAVVASEMCRRMADTFFNTSAVAGVVLLSAAVWMMNRSSMALMPCCPCARPPVGYSIFVNISSYAYDPSVGPAEVRCEVLEDPMRVIIQFLDGGKPFDPLAKEDADTSEEALMSRIGGLGILLVKETMDDVSYEYKDGQNILTILKNL